MNDISESKFEDMYRSEISIHSNQEGVSFSSALDNLWFNFNRLGKDEEKFKKMLTDWGIIN